MTRKTRKCRISPKLFIAGCLLLPWSLAVADSLRVYNCDSTIAQQPLLKIHDDASIDGALVQDAQLITLANGMKAVTFAVRYSPRVFPSNLILKVRYTVTWTDDCGRLITGGTNTINGIILNPRQYQAIQSTAFHATASRATLRVYVE